MRSHLDAPSGGQHRLIFSENLDALASGRALWQSRSTPSCHPHLIEALHSAIHDALTDKQRTAIELFFFEGLSEGAIARRLGVSQQVVHKRLFGDVRGGRVVGGALQKLRKALTRAGHTP